MGAKRSKRKRHKKQGLEQRGGVSSDPQRGLRADYDHGSAPKPSSNNGTSQPAGTMLIHNQSDLEQLRQLRNHADWQIPAHVFAAIPSDLAKLATGKDAQGQPLEVSEETQKFAMRELRMLAKDNWQKDKSSIQVDQRNVYLTRHTRAETPEADEEHAEETAPAVEAVAFREKVSGEEMEEVAEELQALGLMGLLLGQHQQ